MKFLTRSPRLAAKCNRVFRIGKYCYAVCYDNILECLRFERCDVTTVAGVKYYRFRNRGNAWDAERILLYISALQLLPVGTTHKDLMWFADGVKAQAAQGNFAGVVYHANKIQAQFSLAATAKSLLNIAALFYMERKELGNDYIQATQDRKINLWLQNPECKKFFVNKAFDVLEYDLKIRPEIESYLDGEAERAIKLEGILNG